eukprot:gb/GECG01012873.1/.p1 GENE.gb/GECG01012873.1/~~gb/GECG01012873.1/.p1  ORF type:complete len:393 (+),score=53.90 gb/GECG01012873.1/:1-1179(+)
MEDTGGLGRLHSGTSAYEQEDFGRIDYSTLSTSHSGPLVHSSSVESNGPFYRRPTDNGIPREWSTSSFDVYDGRVDEQGSNFLATPSVATSQELDGSVPIPNSQELDDSHYRRSSRAKKRGRYTEVEQSDDIVVVSHNPPRGSSNQGSYVEDEQSEEDTLYKKMPNYGEKTSDSVTIASEDDNLRKPSHESEQHEANNGKRCGGKARDIETMGLPDVSMIDPNCGLPDKIFREYSPDDAVSTTSLSSQPLELRLLLSSKAAAALRPNSLRSQFRASLIQWGTGNPLTYLDEEGEIRQAEPCVKRLKLMKEGNRTYLSMCIQRKGAANDHSKSLPLSRSHGGFPFHFIFEITATGEVIKSNPVEILSKETQKQRKEKSVVKLLESKGKLDSLV